MASKSEVLADYARAIAEIRAEGERDGMSNEELDSLISASLDAVAPKEPRPGHLRSLLRVLWWLFKALLAAAVLYALVACHSPTQKTLSRHIQGFIYPFMRGVRKITLPLLRAYPDLAEWHEEPCLVRNPFYGRYGPDCWPCEDVRSVLVLAADPANFAETYYHGGVPFVIQGGSGLVGWQDLYQLYADNVDQLKRSRVSALDFATTSLPLAELLATPERNVSDLHPSAHLTWRVTRSAAARILRQLFPRPQFVPKQTEVTIQRFVFLDAPLAQTYELPLTDFANVWVSQGSGARLLSLSPSPHCITRCHPVSVLMQPGDLLFYNWQFWRPRSLPVQGSTGLSLTFVGSFY